MDCRRIGFSACETFTGQEVYKVAMLLAHSFLDFRFVIGKQVSDAKVDMLQFREYITVTIASLEAVVDIHSVSAIGKLAGASFFRAIDCHRMVVPVLT